MSTEAIFHLGIGLGVAGFGLALGLLFGPGLLDRLEAARRRKADRGWVRL